MGWELPSNEQWAAIREAIIEAKLPLVAICAQHGVSRAQVVERARCNKWEVIVEDEERERGIMMDVFALAVWRQMKDLSEVALTSDGKQVAALTKLATQLERMLGAGGKIAAKPRQSREMQELRAKIGKRLDELKVR